MSLPPPLTVATLPSAQACVDLIDRLSSEFKKTFKRAAKVPLFVSTTFGATSEDSRLRSTFKGLATNVASEVYSVVARPQDADQEWEARWFATAAKPAAV